MMVAGRIVGENGMLFNLLVPLADEYIVFNLFRYLTFRTGGAIMTALLVSFLFGPAIINWLKSAQNGNTPVREDVPEGHLKKVGTPTMGGFLILFGNLDQHFALGGSEEWVRLGCLVGDHRFRGGRLRRRLPGN